MRERAATLLMVLGMALLGVACGHPEQKVIDQYFMALNSKDNQTLGSFAVVSLDTKGKKVDKWTITQASAEDRVPAPLPDLVKKAKDADADVAANKKEATKYSLDHLMEVDQVREAMKKGAKVPANLAPHAAKWEEFSQKDRELKKAAAEAKDAVEKEKRLVAMSLGTSEDLEGLTGELVTKQFDLAMVIAGQTQGYTMVLKKYEMAKGQGQPKMMSRWVVFQLQPKA